MKRFAIGLIWLLVPLSANAGLYDRQDFAQTAGPGVYYPGPYYSRTYLQRFNLLPNQRMIYLRLAPYQHYGAHRLGWPTPGIAYGSPESDRFPYRYTYGFVAPHKAPPPPVDECAEMERDFPIGPSRRQPGR